MPSINSRQALTILTATENAPDNQITRLPIPDKYLGTPEFGKSGFSFGAVQLDIGSNTYAKRAYSQILSAGVSGGVITQAQSDYLSQFAVKRPDILFPDTYKAARAELNSTVFDPNSSIAPQVNQIIATQQQSYLDSKIVPMVNNFLNTHTTGVFDPSDPGYATSVAAVVSAANISGNLGRFTSALDGNADPNLADVQSAFKAQLDRTYQPSTVACSKRRECLQQWLGEHDVERSAAACTLLDGYAGC